MKSNTFMEDLKELMDLHKVKSLGCDSENPYCRFTANLNDEDETVIYSGNGPLFYFNDEI